MEELIRHCRLGKPILNKRRKPICPKTEKHYRTWIGKLDRWFNKDFRTITQVDVDIVRDGLKSGEIKKENGQAYNANTIYDVEQKFLKVLLNYLGKPELALFFTEQENIEIPALTREEVERIVAHAKLRDKLIFQILFDGGFRAAEFLNVKYKDLKDEAVKERGYYKVRITKSKTLPRTVGLTLPLSTEILKLWLSENKDKIGTNKPLIDLSYTHLALTVTRVSERILRKRITPHTLRHSSATYYCHHLNQYQLCRRYGWSMASDMPKRYIDREGIDDDSINEKITGEESLEFRKQVSALQEQMNIERAKHETEMKALKDTVTSMRDELAILLKENFEDILKAQKIKLEAK